MTSVCDAQPSTGVRTVLFTDIVGSTTIQVERGDCAWRDLLVAHHEVVRANLRRWRGFENDTAGDGFYATFEDATDAVQCALAVIDGVRDLGIEIRAGLHLGDCELVDTKCSGLTVSIGARIAALAGPSQLLASEAVRTAVAHPRLVFSDAGEHELKGVPGRWPLFSVRRGQPVVTRDRRKKPTLAGRSASRRMK